MEQDTTVAVAYDSVNQQIDMTCQFMRGENEHGHERTQDSRVILLAAGVAIGVVKASVVALVDPLPEYRVSQLGIRGKELVSRDRQQYSIMPSEAPTVGAASNMPTHIGMFTGIKADNRNTPGSVSPLSKPSHFVEGPTAQHPCIDQEEVCRCGSSPASVSRAESAPSSGRATCEAYTVRYEVFLSTTGSSFEDVLWGHELGKFAPAPNVRRGVITRLVWDRSTIAVRSVIDVCHDIYSLPTERKRRHLVIGHIDGL
ncbi:unnamed protein product [Phytophthora fragariaefolia]|uniref:Unnamed protein product n=1 Tax=Phytophthora fragariaefolia TaxID=1490495 RepID=A0A9W6YJV5_9STRA|nr:unnamed protein product [Phytophthora fragariaefolia]